jgi:alkanesulfonate monooxygenase SsuD/methylene tetrahydromethanopterin reductase-like flavin-dependent oxidoreductase (luciferase family)
VDYGRPVTFGTFITPFAADPQNTVELAMLTERVGLDLVTFQDHPYQPRFLDTWTLHSYDAACTSRVELAGDVLNLPLRLPAVLASSVASLDRLSGGRVALGLGAGAFWDAIVALGGPRRTPGEAVESLDEAIDVIRERWDTEAVGGIFREGKHYPVVGAKRGPAPAHDVPIWLGVLGPRMLALLGRKADGWLPSFGRLENGVRSLDEGHARIDEAAVAAGRDPAAIRRLINLDTVDAGFLVELVVEHGVDTLILPADDPMLIERFAAEVAPAVREQVAAVRATPRVD